MPGQQGRGVPVAGGEAGGGQGGVQGPGHLRAALPGFAGLRFQGAGMGDGFQDGVQADSGGGAAGEGQAHGRGRGVVLGVGRGVLVQVPGEAGVGLVPGGGGGLGEAGQAGGIGGWRKGQVRFGGTQRRKGGWRRGGEFHRLEQGRVRLGEKGAQAAVDGAVGAQGVAGGLVEDALGGHAGGGGLEHGQDQLRLGPGEGHVQQALILRFGGLVHPRGQGRGGLGAQPVAAPAVQDEAVHGSVVLPGPASEQDHHLGFQALGLVHGEDLHGGAVGLDPVHVGVLAGQGGAALDAVGQERHGGLEAAPAGGALLQHELGELQPDAAARSSPRARRSRRSRPPSTSSRNKAG